MNERSEVSRLERLVICTDHEIASDSRVRDALEEAGFTLIAGEPKRQFIISAPDIEPLKLRIQIADDRNSHFGRRRKKGGFRKYK